MTHGNEDRHSFKTAGLEACVMAEGAELCALRDKTGVEYLWPADPVWPRHAPVLFPIISRLQNDTLIHRGRQYPITPHGFARDRRFTWVERSPTACLLALTDDDRTRAMYPFAFRFEVGYAIVDTSLEITFTIKNTGDEVLPASMGAHPAFRWPLLPGLAKEAYELTFDAEETAPLRVLSQGLLLAERPSPIAGRHLALTEDLFTADALILPHPASHSVRFAAPKGPALTVSWEGFQQLALWSKAGGDFLCIEPWCGMGSPSDFNGEFIQKPWLLLIPPGESRAAVHRVTLEP